MAREIPVAGITVWAVTADPSLHRRTRTHPAGSSVREPQRQHCSRVPNQRLPIGRHRQPMAQPGTNSTLASLQLSGTLLLSGRQLTQFAE
ncbi:hypothetical protein G5C60_36065 [Streptomyces sp. HC44]|uniref:Uncharacterized protein n=1 Tax=Streptomyces scabichelini TaxID=2711217 RepID=A0A6G4VG54_9ACTN|nr:hypothetical protein [Streptomyces scabichelini]NGO12875.1 hypothetical protein [Streptomyces scabichelini]